ncbi:MAG: UDP-N-acetylmuramate dehydrogenase [Fusobacteriaceae bacterium]
MKLLKNYSMKERSNMKIGGITSNFFIIDKREEIKDILDNYENIFVIGNGTNTLINDGKLKTSFLSLENFNLISELENNIIQVEAGVEFSDLIKYIEEKNYSGIESMAGIPGTVGGLVYMNGGAHGVEIFDFIKEIEIVDEYNFVRKISKDKIIVSYRNTEIQKKKWIILSALFEFKKGFDKARVIEVTEKRESSHPLSLPNLGSSFKNPKDKFAVKLIIESGMSGYRIGDAQVSEKHPNFIVNLGTATFEDVRTVISDVKKKVKQVTGIELEEEIVTINE